MVLGFVALGPAWWFRQAIGAMFFWEGVVLAAWLWDLLRLPRPEQLEVRRIWEKRPCLGVPGNVVVEVRNGGERSIHAGNVGETPTQIERPPPHFGLRLKAAPHPLTRLSVM